MNPGLSNVAFVEALIAPLRDRARSEGLWRPVAVSRGTELMLQGAAAPSVFVLESGLVKLAYLTAEGAERIKSFIADRGLFGPGLDDDQGRYSAVALEQCCTAALPVSWLARRIAESVELQAARATFETWLLARKEAREQALLCDSAEVRYRAFLEREPQLAARLQQADIARFIGVTPIAFSRIKRRVAA